MFFRGCLKAFSTTGIATKSLLQTDECCLDGPVIRRCVLLAGEQSTEYNVVAGEESLRARIWVTPGHPRYFFLHVGHGSASRHTIYAAGECVLDAEIERVACLNDPEEARRNTAALWGLRPVLLGECDLALERSFVIAEPRAISLPEVEWALRGLHGACDETKKFLHCLRNS